MKPILVCIHGQESTSQVWNNFKKEQSHKYDIITYDLIGHGTNSRIPDSFSFEMYIAELYNLVQSHKLTHFTLLAHSMGGRIATVFAHRYAHMVNEVILLDCKLHPVEFKKGTDELISNLNSVPNQYSSKEALYDTYMKLGYPLRKLERWEQHGTITCTDDGNGNQIWNVVVSPYVGYLIRQHILSSSLPIISLPLITCPVLLLLASDKSIVCENYVEKMKHLGVKVYTISDSNHQNIIDRYSQSLLLEVD